MTPCVRTLVLALSLVALAAPASAYDPKETFLKGSVVLSGEGGGGAQFNLEGFSDWSKLDYFFFGGRVGYLPFEPAGPGPLWGSFEIGLEPYVQYYTSPGDAYWVGAFLTFKWHFLGLGRIVPYAELGAGVGGTNLKVREIRSDFAFMLQGGLGASVFVTDRTAIYAGARYLHNSNGGTSSPNRGYESINGVGGVSFFFE
ncbi:MAG: acyloxyacyl hydrolase [Candidatus Rokuibacteriota bacterium]